MRLVRRTYFVAVSLIVTLLVQSGIGADLRTTVCDRPVCRTVAIAPEQTVKQRPKPELVLPSDEVFEDFGDGACHGSCTSQCDMCCFPFRDVWAEIDFLLGWRHGIRTPALVTTSPAGTAQAAAGVIPGATILYPSEPFGEDARPGGRIAIGAWLDPSHCWGVEGRYFALADEATNFNLTSDGAPILARPFFDVAGNAPAARLLAFDDVFSPGSIDISTESEFYGGDALLRRSLCHWGCGELDFLVGYQFARLDEALVITDLATAGANPPPLIATGTTLAITDSFSTRNEYHAASLGAAMKWERDCLRWEVMGKIGLGNMKETVTIAGTTVVTVPGQAAAVSGFGLLAQGVNLGTFTQDKFCASPEVNMKCVYQLNECVDVSCGYTFLYLTNVAQPGRQIDVDLRVPTDRFRIRDSEFWMHAFQCGVSVRF